jgi:hypothetical protein
LLPENWRGVYLMPESPPHRDWPHAAHILSLLYWLTETGAVRVQRDPAAAVAELPWHADWTTPIATYTATGTTLYTTLRGLRGQIPSGYGTRSP